MGRLDGKAAIVSGGARGLGEIITRVLALEGAAVAFGGRRLDEVSQGLEAELKEQGSRALNVRLDVAQAHDWKAAVEAAEAAFGRVDVLVNNAGVGGRSEIDNMPEELWDTIMNTKVKGAFLGLKNCLPARRRAGRGSVINIGSITGLIARPYASAAYSAANAGLASFSKQIAVNHARESIRSNIIHAGSLHNERWLASVAGDEEALRFRLGKIPMERLGGMDEIAACVVFLASEESAYVTGADLVVDGGAVAW